MNAPALPPVAYNVRLRTKTAKALVLGCLLAGLAATIPAAGDAQPQPAITTYVVTIAGATNAGGGVVHEALSLARGTAGSRLALAGPDGSVVSTPINFTARGEIASGSEDGAVTCYNMAIDALDAARRADADPARVFVRFGNSVVSIPLHVTATQTHGDVRTAALTGVSTGIFSGGDASVNAGIVIEATVTQGADGLDAATFDERQYLAAPDNVVGRSTCVLQRAVGRAVTSA